MITFKKLENPVELFIAYSLVYDIYLKYKYIKENPLKMRIRNFELSDSIFTFGAFDTKTNRIVGVLSFIKDSPLGLPADEIPEFRQKIREGEYGGEKYLELTNLAVLNKYRKFFISHRLMEFVAEFIKNTDSHRFFMQISPNKQSYFEKIGVKFITGPVKTEHDNLILMSGNILDVQF